MVVNPLADVMSYFKFSFLAYIVLFIIISLNLYKALYIKKKTPKGNSFSKLILISDLVIDMFCGLAMATGLIFQGVLADNNAVGHNNWSSILFVISIVSLTIFVLNVIVVFKEKK